MWFSSRSKARYSSLEDSSLPEYTEDLKLGYQEGTQKVQISSGWLTAALLLCIPLTSIATVLVVKGSQQPVLVSESTSIACTQPSIRREWRTLDTADRASYIKAVKCLSTRPSTMGVNGTAYDDFPWVHQKTAPTAHKSAPFFPWHRYYIHSYEKALKEQCAYDGVLPYWDWSLDAHDFENSPVWDAKHGFGGDGDVSTTVTVGNGSCVQDGPFAGLEAMYYGDQLQPHCLSRGFAKGDELRELSDLVHPEAIENLMDEPSYETFASELERRAHHFVSHSIRGDFSKYTGPYDPIFFLHHANLDRLWAKWQHKHNANEYAGKASMFSSSSASLTDTLNIGGLMADVPVSEVMDTKSGMFCYQY